MITKGYFTKNTPKAMVTHCNMPDHNLDLHLHVCLKAKNNLLRRKNKERLLINR